MSTNKYSRPGHPMFAEHGRFWRCRHGCTFAYDCWHCGVWHPFRYTRSKLRSLRFW